METLSLNSDQIQAHFGSYGVDVLSQSEALRLASLYSEHNGKRVCRTLAITHFILPLAASLADSDRRIRDGQSIGATLRADGFRVIRSDAVFTHMQASSKFSALANQSVPVGTELAVQVYTLAALRADERLPYAIIAEAYHPEHTRADATLAPIAEVIMAIDGERASALRELLAVV